MVRIVRVEADGRYERAGLALTAAAAEPADGSGQSVVVICRPEEEPFWVRAAEVLDPPVAVWILSAGTADAGACAGRVVVVDAEVVRAGGKAAVVPRLLRSLGVARLVVLAGMTVPGGTPSRGPGAPLPATVPAELAELARQLYTL